ncbi:Transcription factor DIVARICATA [Hibiscus syriacus]|uniref:Transcription factor DIVARICATA n=1 Tax=Hibiscus syriacus TaxID=106335 RepID=A0A6A3C695_HIBSY|nr:transcription factor DIVARICATA-like [Hibiscus syriacus]KAE8723441.1 Transcription factor DIVARICATA [Hibiscus syriacus]
MEALFATSFMSNLGLFDQDIRKIPYWTKEENKRFESALAIYGEDVPDRWIKVAAMIPGKTVSDVIKQYRELEEDVFDIDCGRVPIPGYLTSSFTSEMVNHHEFDAYRKRSTGAKGPDHERKKGVPWTEEEHRRFLMGLMKYGKGDWRNISKNFVISKTPTQVASHAQKYYQRQVSGGKDKKRPSIHDITTLNITANTVFSQDQSTHALALKQKLSSIQKWDHNDNVSATALEGDWFTSSEQYQTSMYGAQSSVF